MAIERIGIIGGEPAVEPGAAAKATAPAASADPFAEVAPEELTVSESLTEDAAISEEEGVDQPPPRVKQVPLAALIEARGQRNEFKTELREAQKKIDRLETEQAPIRERYKSFKNPSSQMAWDADFVETMQRLSNKNAAVAQAWKAVEGSMAEGGVAEKPEVSAARGVADKRVEALLERDARREADTILRDLGVNTKFRKLVADYVVKSDETNLEGVTRDHVVGQTKRFLKEHGFESTDILEVKGGEPKPAEKPATGGATKAATAPATRAKGSAKEPEDSKAAKSLDELHERRSLVWKDIARGQTAS